jgi:predicted dehydrogenase
MVARQRVRIGIVGAGKNTRDRHIPGFRKVPGVELIGVVNRTPESTGRVAKEFDIPRTYAHWQELVADPEIDAILIGTWPNLHCEVTCAALEAGKHVLTEARMARDAAEAHRMSTAAQRFPDLVKQIVPSPFGLIQHDYVRGLIREGFLGEIREVIVIGATDLFWDASRPLHWRQDAEISGHNVLSLGILHETVLRWAPAPTRVRAQSATFEPSRPAADDSEIKSNRVPVTVPDSLQVTTELENGGRGLYHLSGICLFGPGHQIHLYGSEGTIKYEISPVERLLTGRAGDDQLLEFEIPQTQRGGWRVEAEFIAAIRGEETVRLTDFATGVRYMEFTEAVSRSVRTNAPVPLPLPEFAHADVHAHAAARSPIKTPNRNERTPDVAAL